MINEDLLINPIVHVDLGQCPLCGGVLMVIDSETSCLLLAPNGNPVQETTTIRCEGVCQSCKHSFPMIRHGFGYRVYSRGAMIFKKYQIQQERKSLSHTNVRENPFVMA